jgi:prepilin signal peptidase PulO-like enzyme (type II secretory pathway)
MFSASWEDGLFVAAAFVVGAIVGSFLNVVVYRVPAGRSVVAGRSACPACGRPVRARDNVPVFGWLMLRGRCRDCGTAIPATYAIVEAGCGLALAALAAAEVIAWRASGSSLPLIDRAISLGEFRWLLGWIGRAVAILTVVAWALLARAGHVVSWWTACAMAGVVATLVTAASPSPAWGAVHAIGGAAAGWVAGFWAGGPAGQRILILIFIATAGGWPALAGWFWSLRGG